MIPILTRITAGLTAARKAFLAAVSSRVSDQDSGWAALSGTRLDQGWGDLSQQFEDSLEAWRKNPLARRIVSLTSDFVVGDGITISSNYSPLQRFIDEWWHHPENKLPIRLEALCDDLTRNGELFPTLHINHADGMSYVRFMPASEVDKIEWRPGDYEAEIRYHQMADYYNPDGRWWLSPRATTPADAEALMLHYAVNRPVGCIRGESDLAPALVWLKRYSHWLEDRVRLNWAARMFLWLVTVPTGRVNEKQQTYKSPPESGSIIVHDEGEQWDLKTPQINATGAAADGRAIKRMAAVATGTPLHYLSDEENANLATAQAMQEPTNRHYSRRQRYFCFMLRDLTATAFNIWRAHDHTRWREVSYRDIDTTVQEIVRTDNLKMARAGRDIVQMLALLRDQLTLAGVPMSHEFNRLTVSLAMKFAGEVMEPAAIDAMLATKEEASDDTPTTPPQDAPDDQETPERPS
jgi:hypothetical protein